MVRKVTVTVQASCEPAAGILSAAREQVVLAALQRIKAETNSNCVQQYQVI